MQQAVRTSLAKNESSLSNNNTDNKDERSKLRNLDASNSNSTTTGGNTGNTKLMQSKEGSTSKEGFMIAIDTSKTSIVDSLVSIAAAEASFVPGRWERSFRRLGKEGEGSMGL